MTFETFERNSTDLWTDSMMATEYLCWQCGNGWSGFDTHCPECGEPYQKDVRE